MSFYLGSFAGGLFNGASSAFQIYNMYQGIQKTTLDLDAAQQAKDAIAGDAANKNVPGYQSGMTSAPGVQIPAGDVSGSPSSGPYVVGGVQSQGTAGTSSPATTTHSGPVNVPTHEAVWVAAIPKRSPARRKKMSRVLPAVRVLRREVMRRIPTAHCRRDTRCVTHLRTPGRPCPCPPSGTWWHSQRHRLRHLGPRRVPVAGRSPSRARSPIR